MSKSNPRKGTGKKKESVVQEIEEEAKKIEEGVKKEAKKIEKAVERKPAKARPARPAGRVPDAVVSSRNGTEMVTRVGRGFSFGELAGSGLAPSVATTWGARVDPRRRSVLQGNVDSLKAWASHPRAAVRAEKEAKKVGEELREVAEEVEMEAAVVEKEAVKVEKKVKREVKKAEKVVKAKVEKKAKPKKKA
ncbi:MAG: ribosomal protein L13e [Nitrososphaerota archaeon]|nr:ribosomal protein L13e [Nitrososphaerota archaeon]